MKKTSPAAIRNTAPLSRSPHRGDNPLRACNICGKPSQFPLVIWREHDERDQPIAGNAALVFVARDHDACGRALNAHPRLYVEETGEPGAFPGLCGPCSYRRGAECECPLLRKNGGAGLRIGVYQPFGLTRIQTKYGCRSVPAVANHCPERTVPVSAGHVLPEETQTA